jgi:hypothetical protein
MQVGSQRCDNRVGLLFFTDPVRISRYPGGMSYPFKIVSKVAFHLDGDTLNKKLLFLGQQFRRHGAQALLCIRAVRGAAEIHPGIDHLVAAIAAFAG